MSSAAAIRQPISARLLTIALILLICAGMFPILARVAHEPSHADGLRLDGEGLLVALAVPSPAPALQLASATVVGSGSIFAPGSPITLGAAADNNAGGGGLDCPIFGGLGCNTFSQNLGNAFQCLNPILAIASIFSLGSWGCAKFILDAIKQVGAWVLSEVLLEIVHTMNVQVVNSVVSMTKFVMVDLIGGNYSGFTPVVNCDPGTDCRRVSWFTTQLAEMRFIGLWIMLPLLLLVILQSIIRGSLFFLLRAFLVMLPIALLGTVAVTTIGQLLISIANDMSSFLANRTVDPVTFGNAFTLSLQKLDKGTFGVYTLFWLIALIISMVIIIIELLLRQMSIYIVMLFFPIGFAALVYSPLVRLFKRAVTLSLALIFMQPFITMVVCAGFAAMASAQASAATTTGAGPANGAHSVFSFHKPDPSAISGYGTAQNLTHPTDNQALPTPAPAPAADPNAPVPAAAGGAAPAGAAPPAAAPAPKPPSDVIDPNIDPDLDLVVHQVILACIIFLTGGFGGFKFLSFTPAGEALENRIANTGNVLGMGDYTQQRLGDLGGRIGARVKASANGNGRVPAGDRPQSPAANRNPAPTRPPGRGPAAPRPPRGGR